MRPHRLRVQAFGAFAATEEVVFDDLEGLFLLHGETGAGKTTLLDAIAFALYGRVPGERGTAKRLRSDYAAPGTVTEIELEATIGGRRLLITRKPEQDRVKKKGAGTVREPASVRLDELTPAGSWENKSTRVVEADAEIGDLMGMSSDQFFQVVLLPQGQFAQFLHAKAQEKEALLQKLFGTDRFRTVEQWLADRRRATEKDVTAAEGSVHLLVAQLAQAAGAPVPESAESAAVPGPVPDPWQAVWAAALADGAAADRDSAAALVTAGRADLDQALAAKTAAANLADRQRRRRDALRRREDLDSAAAQIVTLRAEAEAASRAAEVAPVLDESDRATAAAESARRAEQRARAAVGELALGAGAIQPLATASPHQLRAAAERQRAQLGRLDQLRAVARQAVDEDSAEASARAQAARIEQDLAAAGAEAARREQDRPGSAQARDTAGRAAADLPAAQSAAEAARSMAADAAALVKDRTQRDKQHAAHLTAREKALTLRAEALVVREARIDGMRAELAATMTDGTPCPVCGSLDHPDPVEPTFDPVSRDQEDKANARADTGMAEADKAGREVAAAEARVEQLAKRLGAAGFAELLAAPGAPFTADTALWADVMTLTAAARQADATAKALEATAARLTSQAATLTAEQRALDDLDDAIARDKARLVELTEQRTARLAEADAAARRAVGHRDQLRAQLGDAADLDAALAATSRAADALTTAADAADDAVRTAAEARETGERAIRASLTVGFGPAAVTGIPVTSEPVAAARAAFRETRWRREAADRVSRHEADALAVAGLLADPDLDVPLDPPVPVAETADEAARVQQAHDAATAAYATASHTASQLASLKPQLDGALATLAPLRDRAGQAKQLADLAAGLGTANQYKMTLSSFVLAARLEEVALAASERLLTMTSGRYSLVHSDARKGNGKAGLSLLVCDGWTGQDRDTATLSGGETFQASLALALGLADVVTAESAGTPMEALFVDEGFGTLDEDALDEVMNVLDSLRAGGRVVGIVSHVTELRQRIPAQVFVRKSRTGSKVEVTAG